MRRTHSGSRSLGQKFGVLVGASGQGKTTVVDTLIRRGPVNPLRLEGKFLGDRTDVVLRMVGLTGLRPEGTNADMLRGCKVKNFPVPSTVFQR